MKFTIWQCRDECCIHKPHSDRWWNVSVAPGNYESVRRFSRALVLVRRGAIR